MNLKINQYLSCLKIKQKLAFRAAISASLLILIISGYQNCGQGLKINGALGTSNNSAAGIFSACNTTSLKSVGPFISLPQGQSGYSAIASNIAAGVFVKGSTIYAATPGGLSISGDNGNTFLTLTTAQGLASNNVQNVFVDNNGIFAGTDSGLSISIDGGKTFSKKTIVQGLASNNIQRVLVANNIIYVGTDFGLSVSLDGGCTFSTSGLVQFTNYASNTFALLNSNLYMANANGVFVSNLSGNQVSSVKLPATVTSTLGYSVATDNVALYVGSSSGLFKSIDGINFSPVTGLSGSGYGAYVQGSSIYVPTSTGLAISTDGGQSFSNKTSTNGLSTAHILNLAASGSILLVGTNDGLSVSTNNGTSFTNIITSAVGNGQSNIIFGATAYPLLISENSVLSVYTSGQNIFAATPAGLLNSLDGGNTFKVLTTSQGLGGNQVYDVTATAQGTLLVATNNGLSISTNGGASFTDNLGVNFGPLQLLPGTGFGSNMINVVNSSPLPTIYVTQWGGAEVSSDGGKTFVRLSCCQAPPSPGGGGGGGGGQGLSVFASGKTIAVGTGQLGLSISLDGGATFPSTSGLFSSSVTGVDIDSNGTIYAATPLGLAISTDQGKSFSVKNSSQGLGNIEVYSVTVSNNVIYLGTAGGLSISKDGGNSFTNYTTAQGLASNFVYNVFVANGNIYASTNNGLSVAPIQ